MKSMKPILSLLIVWMLLVQCVAFSESAITESSDDPAQVTGWYLEHGEWSYFDEAGIAVTGPFEVGDGYYTADEQGHVAEGWLCLKDVWYELTRITGENEADILWKWTYVETNETEPAKSIQSGEQSVQVMNTEAPLTGWIPEGTETARYFNEDGTSDIGWKTIGENTFFFTPDGRVPAGKAYIDGQVYEFTADGVVAATDKSEPEISYEDVATPTDLKEKADYSVKDVTVTETIHFETKYKHDNNRYEDEGTIVLQKGENGEKVVTYEVVTKDGVEVTRTLKSEMITKEPVERILSVPKKPHVVEQKEETVNEEIPFETEIQNDTSRVKGEPDQIAQEGVNGVREIVYTVTYTDGEETARSVKSEKIAKEPVKKIINVAIGEKLTYTTSHVTVVEVIPYTSKTVQSADLMKGETEVAQKGVNGEKEVVYSIKKDLDGNILAKDLVSEKVTKEMQEEIIKEGTKEHELPQEESSEEIEEPQE